MIRNGNHCGNLQQTLPVVSWLTIISSVNDHIKYKLLLVC